MPTQKPLSELSPAYQRRIIRGMLKGETRSQAYGHARKGELLISHVRAVEKAASTPALGKSFWLATVIQDVSRPEYTKTNKAAILSAYKQLLKVEKKSLKARGKKYDELQARQDELVNDIIHLYRTDEGDQWTPGAS